VGGVSPGFISDKQLTISSPEIEVERRLAKAIPQLLTWNKPGVSRFPDKEIPEKAVQMVQIEGNWIS
jgi:hypothetical protein